MNGVVKFMPVWRRGLKPSDNPEIVREFETRLLLVVFPVLFFFYLLHAHGGCAPCWYAYTAVYTLAADGAVFDTPKN